MEAFRRVVQHVIALLLISVSASVAAGVELAIDGVLVQTTPGPTLVRGAIGVPVQFVEVVGGKLDSRITEGATDISFTLAGHRVNLALGSQTAWVDGRAWQLPFPAYRASGTVMLPLTLVTDVAGIGVQFNLSARRLELQSRGFVPGVNAPVPPAPPAQTDSRATGPKAATQTGIPLPVSTASSPLLTNDLWLGLEGTNRGAPPGATGSAAEATSAVRLHSIQVDPTEGRMRIRLGLSAPVRVTSGILTNPDRIYLDIHGAVVHQPIDRPVHGDALVQRVRAQQFSPSIVRVVVDLTRAVGYKLEDEGLGSYSLWLNAAVKGATWERGPSGVGVRLDLGAESEYRIARLREPERLVIDLLGTSWVAPPLELPLSDPEVSAVRVSQFQRDITRIVLDLRKPIEIPPGFSSGRLRLVNGSAFVDLPTAQSAGRIGLAPNGNEVVIEGGPSLHEVKTDALPGLLRVWLPQFTLPDPVQELKGRPGGAVRSLRAERTSGGTWLYVTLNYAARYRLVSQGAGRGLVLTFELPDLRGRSVLLDPGHGGVDGGAVGVRLREADVNLDIGLRLAKLLREAGAQVHLTRTEDVFVNLIPRAELAHAVGADLLLSIHHNAAPGVAAFGTETYCCPKSYENSLSASALKELDARSLRLAQMVHSAVVSQLDRVDRGVKAGHNMLAVLRHSRVPSILVEIAFIDNPAEEALLQDPLFRQGVSVALFSGIASFLQADMEWEGALPVADESLRVELAGSGGRGQGLGLPGEQPGDTSIIWLSSGTDPAAQRERVTAFASGLVSSR